MTEPSSSQQWCGFRGPELCSGDPLRMGSPLPIGLVVRSEGCPHIHARLDVSRRTGGTPIAVLPSATI